MNSIFIRKGRQSVHRLRSKKSPQDLDALLTAVPEGKQKNKHNLVLNLLFSPLIYVTPSESIIASSPPLFCPSICFPNALTPFSPFTYPVLPAPLHKPGSWLRFVREAHQALNVWCYSSALQSWSIRSQHCVHWECRKKHAFFLFPAAQCAWSGGHIGYCWGGFVSFQHPSKPKLRGCKQQQSLCESLGGRK